MHGQRFSGVVLLLSGALLGLTPGEPWLWPLGWLALVPLWWVTFARKGTLRQGMLWGAAYHGLALSWLTHLHPLTWLGIPWGISLVIVMTIWFLVSLWGALLVGTWAWITSRITQPLLRLLT
ncbi:MAG: hypothetical protein Q6K81_06020, partial [Gloeomargarita sp. DG02_5_bins_242]